MTSKAEVERTARLVGDYLDRHQPPEGTFRWRVVPGGIQPEDEWTYVVVEPDGKEVRSYDCCGRLAEAELEIEEKEKQKNPARARLARLRRRNARGA